MQAGLKRKRDEAAAERAAVTTQRAKAEADIADLEEQLGKHERTQVAACAWQRAQCPALPLLDENNAELRE